MHQFIRVEHVRREGIQSIARAFHCTAALFTMQAFEDVRFPFLVRSHRHAECAKIRTLSAVSEGYPEAFIGIAPQHGGIFAVVFASVEELHQAALENSEKMFPLCTFDLNERMRQSFIDDMKQDGMPDEMIEELLKDFPESRENAMTVVTNDVGVNGAAAIFYSGVMDKIAETTKGDYFILPSSVHETIILPDNGAMTAKELEAMVTEINATQVEPWDRLTDQVYHYDPIDRVFEKAATFEARIEKKAEVEKAAKKQSIMDKLGEKKEAAKTMIGEKKTPLRTAEVSL